MVTASSHYDNASLVAPGQKQLQISSATIAASTMGWHIIYNSKENWSQVSGCKWLILPTKSHSYYNESGNKGD